MRADYEATHELPPLQASFSREVHDCLTVLLSDSKMVVLSVKILYVSKKVFKKSILKNLRSVSRSRSLSTVA